MAEINEQRTKKRAKETGEVFTPPCEIARMLSTLDSSVWKENKTFCDPAAGDGNIVVSILAWKIAEGHDPTEALRSVYAVELMKDNWTTMRRRLIRLAGDDALHRSIIMNNIVWANTLEYDMLFDKDNDNRKETARLEN